MGARLGRAKSLIFLSSDYFHDNRLKCLLTYREILKSLRSHYYIDHEFDMQRSHVRQIIADTPRTYTAIEHRKKQAAQLTKLFSIGKFPNLLKYLK